MSGAAAAVGIAQVAVPEFGVSVFRAWQFVFQLRQPEIKDFDCAVCRHHYVSRL